jgi:hypothetical protein
MEQPAIEILESELSARDVSSAQVEAHATMRERNGLLRHQDGTVVRCNFCARPASEARWQWHRLWGWFLPLFPRNYPLCMEHLEHLPTDVYGRILHYDYEGETTEQGEDPVV